jgi:hypothetical protein
MKRTCETCVHIQECILFNNKEKCKAWKRDPEKWIALPPDRPGWWWWKTKKSDNMEIMRITQFNLSGASKVKTGWWRKFLWQGPVLPKP